MKELDSRIIQRKYVKEAFDKIASTYDRGRRTWYELIEIFRKYVSSNNGFIGDFGCGTGRNTVVLAVDNDVVGLDISWNMIKILKKKSYRVKRSHKIYPIVASMNMLPFRDNVFKAVTMFAALHNIPYIENRRKVLSEVWRVCKNNGVLLITVWRLLYPKNLLRSLIHWIRYNKEFGDALIVWRKKDMKIYRFYHFFTGKELSKLIRHQKFSLIRIFVWSPRKKFLKDNIVAIAVKHYE